MMTSSDPLLFPSRLIEHTDEWLPTMELLQKTAGLEPNRWLLLSGSFSWFVMWPQPWFGFSTQRAVHSFLTLTFFSFFF